jgi:hypothetical protein
MSALRLAAVSLTFLMLTGAGQTVFRPPGQGTECVSFASDGRLHAGEVFRLRLPRDLEFRLAGNDGGWDIVIRPLNGRVANYLDVTPPLQTRPHVCIGRCYIDARESVAFPRDVRFVVTGEDYKAALDAIAASRQPPYDAGATLQKLDVLLKGRLVLNIDDHSLRSSPERDRKTETLEWIAFTGQVCVPLE